MISGCLCVMYCVDCRVFGWAWFVYWCRVLSLWWAGFGFIGYGVGFRWVVWVGLVCWCRGFVFLVGVVKSLG